MLSIVRRNTVGRISIKENQLSNKDFSKQPALLVLSSLCCTVLDVTAEWRVCYVTCQTYKYSHISDYSIVPSKEQNQLNCGSKSSHLFCSLNTAHSSTSESTHVVDHLLNILLGGNWLGKTKWWIKKEFLIFATSICDILLFITVVFQWTHTKRQNNIKVWWT